MSPSSGPERDEASLVEACRSGDPEAAGALVALYQKPLLKSVGHLVGSWDIAEEIVQDAFLRTFDRIDQIDPKRGVRWWLWRVAFNLARDWFEKYGRKEYVASIRPNANVLLVQPPEDPEARVLRQEETHWLRAALARLPVPMREVVVLHYVEGLPFADIGRILGTSTPALRMRALRGKALLRTMLVEQGLV